MTKWLVADFSPFQILFFRAVFAVLPWLLLLSREEAPTRVAVSSRPGLQVLRGILGFAAITCFALAFRFLPLAVAVAIAYSAPIYTTALARPLLGEHVGATRWAAVVVGFGGVLLITNPAAGELQPGVAWAIAGSMLYALTSLVTRRLGADRATTTMLYSMAMYAALGAALLPFVWRQPDVLQWGGLVALGIVGGVAQFFLLQAYRLAPASTLSPFEYTILAWSVVWGFVVWHELPGPLSTAGMLVIAGAGLVIARHEHRNGRARSIAAGR